MFICLVILLSVMALFSCKTAGMLQEEINDLEKDVESTTDSEIKADLRKHIRAKRQSMRDLAAKEVWVIVIYTSILAIIFSLVPLLAHDLIQDCFIRQLFYIGSAGGLGGIVYSILGFTYHYDKGDFNPRFIWWYLFRPFTAVILGVFSFFFIAGGLMSLTDMSVPQGFCYPIKGVMFYCAVAFLAGLSNNAFVKKLNDLAKALFMNTIDTEKGFEAEKRKEIEDAKKRIEQCEYEA